MLSRDEMDYYLGLAPAPRRKSPTRGVRKAFDFKALKRICELHEDEFFAEFDLQINAVNQPAPDDYYLFKDFGSSVLAVAHLDTVQPHRNRRCGYLDTAGGPVVYSGALDDRLGAYTILDLLPKMGIQYDILLTVGEENGCSTAQFFDPGKKDYDWVIEFDRGDSDVVMYQFDDEDTRDLVRQSGARPDHGIFSDIAYLEHLGVKAFNWGVAYRDYHSARGHVYLDEYWQMIGHFLNFHADNYGTRLPHFRRFRQQSSWWGGAAWDEGTLGVSGDDPFPEEGSDDLNEAAALQRAIDATRDAHGDTVAGDEAAGML